LLGAAGSGCEPAANLSSRFALICWMRGSAVFEFSSLYSPSDQSIDPASNTHAPLDAW
jgi:hypothetical protein